MNAVPLVVIGGYLGAGKTTLVNHLLRHAAGRRIAVLVNDFGSVSIDADLIEGAEDGVLALAGGCVCCSFGDDLLGTLERAAQRDPVPDAIVLECSGVGLPGVVARSAALARGVRPQGVLVMVDAPQVRQQAQDRYVGDTVLAQIRQADLLVLNQRDRSTLQEMAAVADWLTGLNPGAPQLAAERAQIEPEVVLGVHRQATPADAAWPVSGGRYRAAPAAPAHRVRHWSRAVDEPVDPQALLGSLIEEAGGTLLRAKGVVQGLDGQWWQVQAMGRRIDVAPHPGGRPGHAGTVVCIGASDDATG